MHRDLHRIVLENQSEKDRNFLLSGHSTSRGKKFRMQMRTSMKNVTRVEENSNNNSLEISPEKLLLLCVGHFNWKFFLRRSFSIFFLSWKVLTISFLGNKRLGNLDNKKLNKDNGGWPVQNLPDPSTSVLTESAHLCLNVDDKQTGNYYCIKISNCRFANGFGIDFCFFPTRSKNV